MKTFRWQGAVVPGMLFFVAQFIYAVALGGPAGLTQMLVLAAIILIGSAISTRLTAQRQHN